MNDYHVFYEDLAGEEEQFNVISDFYSMEDLKIDQIYKLNKKQQEMNNQRRKLVENDKIIRNKKQKVDWNDFCRNLEYNLVNHLQQFTDLHKLKMSFRELKAQNNLEQLNSDSTHLNLKEFVSQSGIIPVDTLDAYNDDVLEYANKRPLQILMLGKPKIGKTKFCKSLAKKIDIVHIEQAALVQKMLDRIKEYEENPETNDEGETIDKRKPWEKQIQIDLQAGKTISNANLLDLVNFEFSFDAPGNKGYILDLPLTFDSNSLDWTDAIIKGKLKLPRIGCRYFSHIIEFDTLDQDVLQFASSIMEKEGEQIKLFSLQERELSRKPKRVLIPLQIIYIYLTHLMKQISKTQIYLFPQINIFIRKQAYILQNKFKCILTFIFFQLLSYSYCYVIQLSKIPVEGEEEEEEPVEEENEEDKQPIFDQELVFRANEDLEKLKKHLLCYEKVTKPRAQEFLQHLTKKEHILIRYTGSSDDELVEYVYEYLGDEVSPLRPLGLKLEGGAEKDLLTAGLEEQKLSRRWSAWQQIDPVELLKGRVVTGKGEFACEYAGRVFLFDSEENQVLFVQNARKYLKQSPELPKTYNLAIIGARLSGKKTYSTKLALEYGWKLVDIEQIVGDVLSAQRLQEVDIGNHIPSNFEARINDVHLNADEWKDFSKGNPLSAKDIWPIVLHKLGYPLQKKPENWGIEKNENEEEEDEETRRLAEEAAKKSKKAPKKKEVKEKPKEGDDERPNTPPPEDLPLREMIQQVNANNKLNPVQGVCIIGQPINEDEIGRLKYHNIPIDKVIILVDRNEEEEGKNLKKREGIEYECNLEAELKFINDATAVLKEHYGDENVKEISIDGTEEEVYNRIKISIDPFFIRFDEDNLTRYQADLAETDDPLPWGEYGPFCPIAFKEDNWLLPGKNDFEVMVRGKRHKFYGEEEKKIFQEHTWKYVGDKTHFPVPPPRIMLMGARGTGLHTQLQRIYSLYKVPVFELKKNLLDHLANEKDKRKQDRLFERGFKAPEFDEEGKVIEDQEIAEDPTDFDKKVHEIAVVKYIFREVEQCFINGNFFDVDEDVVSTPINELLNESKKLPELILHLKVEEKNFMHRKFDEKEVKKEYDRLMEERRLLKLKEKEEARQQRLKEIAESGEEGVEVTPEEQEEEQEAEDPDAPDYNNMISEKKEKLIAQREADSSKLEEYATSFAELGIPVVEINCNAPILQVFDLINFQLKNYLQLRENLLEKYQTFILKREVQEDPDEEIKPFRLDFFERGYTFRKSRYANRNALTLLDIPRVREFPLLYRDRIYYFDSLEEVEKVAKEPLKYLVQKCSPKDVEIHPIVFVIGKPKTGKSTLSKMIESKLNLVRIKLSTILEEYLISHSNVFTAKALDILRSGQTLPDDLIIELIIQRVQQADCKARGWVLDGIPQNRNQGVILHQRKMIPTSVFSVQLSDRDIVERFQKAEGVKKFGYKAIVLHDKLVETESGILENYYLDTFNNLRFINGKISKWGMYDEAKQFIHSSVLCRYNFSRALVTIEPANVSQMALTRTEILENIGKFNNYSPVSIKTRKLFIQNNIRYPYLAYFDGFLYLLDSQEEMQDFLNRPDLYIFQPIQSLNPPHKISVDNIISEFENVSNKGHCVGSLRINSLKKSQPSLLVSYNGEVYSFSNADLMVKFIANPRDYLNINLHDKLPVEFSSENLVKKIAKKGDCTAFLEHHLGNIIMRVLAKLGYRRIKYPTITCKETSLKFIAISLKANNPNKDENYRQKYQQKLQLFLKHCSYSEEIRLEHSRKEDLSQEKQWNDWDEENLLNVTKEFSGFKGMLKEEDKDIYFQKFIH